MQVYYFHTNPRPSYLRLASDLLDQKPVHTGEWQAMDTRGSDMHKTYELEDVSLVWETTPDNPQDVMPAVDTSWAREHFAERVSGQPLNPAPSHVRWPYAVGGNSRHMQAETFDHTYPERFWPKHAGHEHKYVDQDGAVHHVTDPKDLDILCGGTPGIRFHYGDLNDVVSLLIRNPLTRQAYLPIWFPEDTGAGLATYDNPLEFRSSIRVPCTLGYHFMQRGGYLSCRYYIRSCDLYRHLSNDAYFAAALMRWICAEMKRRTMDNQVGLNVRPGKLVMHIANLHAFTGDKDKIKNRMKLVSKYDEDEGIWGAGI